MKRRQFMSLLGGAALTPVLSPHAAADLLGEACGVPLARQDGWPVATISEDKLIDRSALCTMADRLEANAANIHSVLVVRNGKLVFERYFKGSDEISGRFYNSHVSNVTFDASKLHDLKSVSKSVASLAVGVAIDRGSIRSVNESILSFFPELSDLRSAETDRIQLVHALTMSMGLSWKEATPATGDYWNDEARMNMAWDPNRFVLTRSRIASAGQQFFYNTGALRVVSAIIHKATGHPLGEFARTTIFEPLGIAHADWMSFRGETNAGGGLRLLPRDMAKIGQLVLTGGRFNEVQIVSKAWIETSTAPKLNATDGMSYGYLWWLGRVPYRGRDLQWIGALGRGGQSIRIVPELDLVVVVTGGYYEDYSPQAFKTQFGVFRDVVRSVQPS